MISFLLQRCRCLIRVALFCAIGANALCVQAADPTAGDWFVVSRSLAPHGSGIDFTPHGTQPGLFYDVQQAGNCSSCHGVSGSSPPTAGTYLPYSTWSGSMMANATRDPVFFAALDVANHDVPGVGDYCLRCHTSTGWYNGRVVKAGFGQPNNDVTLGAAACLIEGRYDFPDNNSDYGGVTCHYCHRLSESGPNGEPQIIGNGDAWIDDQDCSVFNPNSDGGEPCRRGPYDYTNQGITPPHPWLQSGFHTRSELCATCHDVSSPDLESGPLKTLKLGDGTDTGHPFPIERTYSEWSQSLYADAIFRDGLGDPPAGTPAIARAEQCQSCHMPVSEDADATACNLFGYPNRTGNLPVHQFVGGNTWVPQIIKGEYGDGLGPERETSLDQTTDWARQNLTTAATVATAITGYTPPGAGDGALSLAVKVTNLTGHKLPTGYSEGRRMWINLQVHDANGALIAESGAYDSATGVLTRDSQVRVYEVLQGIFNFNGTNTCDVVDGAGDAMFHFVLSDCIAKDDRIPPFGFRPATTDDPDGYDLRPIPVGSYPETSPGSGVLVNYDSVDYTVTVPAGTPTPLTATARLYYQISSKDYIEFLQREADSNGFAAENDLCSGGPQRPFPVGPQDRSRGEYVYELWNNAPNDMGQPGYGKSPPELIEMGSAMTSD
ncbi:MAG: hypothetical protein WB784_10600 [Rhodanobacteraceae bacterium]